MARLDRKFSKSQYVPNGFGDIIADAVKNKTLPENAIIILNSLINGKTTFKDDLEDVLKKDDHTKGVTGTSAQGILSMVIKLGDDVSKVRSTHNNILFDGLSQLYDRFVDYNDVDNTKDIVYNGNLPSVRDTKKLKQVEFKYNGSVMSLNDDNFRGILNTDKEVDKYVSAIRNGDVSLPDNYMSPVGELYTFFKNIKRRSDSVKSAITTVKAGNFKGDNSNLYNIKKIDSIEGDELQDRKTILNISARIHQIVKGAKVTLPEFNFDNKNFLYYKRNTFDLFIDESRRMSFQFLAYNNPDRIEKYSTYKIQCRIADKVYKDCEIMIDDLGIKEKQMSASAFPIVDAYNEFMMLFREYKNIRDAYIASNR